MSRYTDQATVAAEVDRSIFDGRLRPHATQQGRRDAFISARSVQSHAAMLDRLPGGDLGLVWFGGTQEGVGDISIWFSRLAADSDQWTEPRQLTDDGTRSEQNPVLFTPPGSGEVWLLYTAQTAGNQDTAEVRCRVSGDGGVTWGDAATLFPATEAGGVFIRQPIVVTASGRWLLPVFHCVSPEGGRWDGGLDTSAVMISDDRGRSWREATVPHSTGCVHMSIVELPGGALHALFRSRWADHIYQSRSEDDGVTWSAPVPTSLPNNNSSLQHRALKGGALALVYNHASRADASSRRASLYDEIDESGLVVADGVHPPSPAVDAEPADGAFWGAPRAPMSLAVSRDDGATWDILGDLDQGDGYCLTNNSRDGLNREFSYPVLCEREDGRLDIAYTFFRQTIKHVRVDPTWTGPGS